MKYFAHYCASTLLAFGLIIPAIGIARESKNVQSQDTTIKALRITETDRRMAELWDLSVDEWNRYQRLMKGMAGYRSDSLDPITLLGIYARSPKERRKYAEMLARLEHDRIKRILAFQRAYNKAFQRLYPNLPRIRTNRFTNTFTQGHNVLQTLGLDQQRKVVFVRTHDCQACRSTVAQLAAARTPMDIFVIDAETDEAIRQWAKSMGLDPRLVNSGEITLNHAPTSAAKALERQSLPRIISR